MEVEIVGYGARLKRTITGIETFKKTLDEAEAGDGVGCLLKGTKRHELVRGMVISKPDTVNQYNHISAQLYKLTKSEGGVDAPLPHRQNVNVFSKTWNCSGQVFLPEGQDIIMDGENSTVTFKFYKQLVIEKGQAFTVRLSEGTLATGVFTDVLPN